MFYGIFKEPDMYIDENMEDAIDDDNEKPKVIKISFLKTKTSYINQVIINF